MPLPLIGIAAAGLAGKVIGGAAVRRGVGVAGRAVSRLIGGRRGVAVTAGLVGAPPAFRAAGQFIARTRTGKTIAAAGAITAGAAGVTALARRGGGVPDGPHGGGG